LWPPATRPSARLFKKGLTNDDPLLRRIGALGLGTLGERSAAPALEAQLADPQPRCAGRPRWRWRHEPFQRRGRPGHRAAQRRRRAQRACAEALARDVETGTSCSKRPSFTPT
jgi:HEAT repeat protein